MNYTNVRAQPGISRNESVAATLNQQLTKIKSALKKTFKHHFIFFSFSSTFAINW